jgi:hypothetical protein
MLGITATLVLAGCNTDIEPDTGSGPSATLDASSAFPGPAPETDLFPGAVVRSDYGSVEVATDLWRYRSDASASSATGNDAQVLYTGASDVDPPYRTLRILGARTRSDLPPTPRGSQTLVVDSTESFPSSCTDTAGVPVDCALLVDYASLTDGLMLRYQGIDAATNTFMGVSGVTRSIPPDAPVIVQSSYDANRPEGRTTDTRAQLISNSCVHPGSTFYCYPADSRLLTTFLFRPQSPSPIPPGDDFGYECQDSQVAQIKENVPPFYGGGLDPVFGVSQSQTMLALITDDTADTIPYRVIAFPKPASGWMRVGLDIVFSTDPQTGRFQFLLDSDTDGTWDHVSAVQSGKTLLSEPAPERTANLSFGPYQAACSGAVSNDYARWEITALSQAAAWHTPQ